MRITYVGELGWELHLPTEYAQTVYDALHKAGTEHGLRNAGYRAIETLRLEKGYRAWGSDIGPDHSLYTGRERNTGLGDAEVTAIADRPSGVEAGETTFHRVGNRSRSVNHQIGFLLAGERRLG